jgi:hypothetical protein
MKNLFNKIGLISCVLTIFFSLYAPFAYAQENLFDSLDDIQNKVGESQERIGEGGVKETVNVNVVDFSPKNMPWGSLPKDLSDKLKLRFKDLNDIATQAVYKQTKGNVQDLINFLNGKTFPDSKANEVNLSNDEVNMIVNEIRFKGESQLRSIVLSIAKVMRNLIGGIAILWIVVSGIQMIFAQGDETKLTEQKNSITYALIGLVIILLIERGITLLYGVPGVVRGLSTTNEGLNTEILGLVSFIKAIIGVAAMLMIIISGYQIISAEGEEEKITTQKKGILWVVIGIAVILINKFIVQNLYIDPVKRQIGDNTKALAQTNALTQTNITNIINTFGTVLQYLLGFVGIVAFAALIYGGASMVANFGNDEMVQNAKKIITNAIVGIIIVLSAFALVSTVIKFG